jgi:hypothetical protein
VDEITTKAAKSKRSAKVLFGPTIDAGPAARVSPHQGHIALCCAVAAPGKALRPVLIVKNKHVIVEGETEEITDCGDYGLCWSPNGWQDSVNSFCVFFRNAQCLFEINTENIWSMDSKRFNPI